MCITNMEATMLNLEAIVGVAAVLPESKQMTSFGLAPHKVRDHRELRHVAKARRRFERCRKPSAGRSELACLKSRGRSRELSSLATSPVVQSFLNVRQSDFSHSFDKSSNRREANLDLCSDCGYSELFLGGNLN